MDIITKDEKESRLADGIKTLLNLDEKQFNDVMKKLDSKNNELEKMNFYYLTDGCEAPENEIQLGLEYSKDENGKFIGRAYYGGQRYSIRIILNKISDMRYDIPINSIEYQRAEEILKTRDLNAYIERYASQNNCDIELTSKAFEILKNPELLEKFKDFENNKKEFEIEGKQTELKEYLKILGNTFGEKNKYGRVSEFSDISREFFVPELSKLKENYIGILDIYNLDRYTNPLYEFRKTPAMLSSEIIRKEDEPEWNISEELKEKIYENMPEDLSLEEQAIYIYCKLCKEMKYDEGYFYREKTNDGKYSYEFNKEHLENIGIDTPLTCWDFSRIYSKFVNDLDGDIESVIISEGINRGHFYTGFYTDNVSVMLEAINGKTGGTNDLMKAKNGIQFEGVKIISDKQGIIGKALKKSYKLISGNDHISIYEYIEKLKSLPKEEVDESLQKKIESFIEVMKENNSYGNEAMQTLNAFTKMGFFGEKFEKAHIGRKEEKNGKLEYKRMVIMRRKVLTDEEKDDTIYLLDSETLDLFVSKEAEIIQGLNNRKYTYENQKYKLKGIEEGEGR